MEEHPEYLIFVRIAIISGQWITYSVHTDRIVPQNSVLSTISYAMKSFKVNSRDESIHHPRELTVTLLICGIINHVTSKFPPSIKESSPVDMALLGRRHSEDSHLIRIL